MLCPAPSKAKEILNLGSLPLPCVWNGPATLRLIGPSAPWVPLELTRRERSSFPDSTFLLPLKVFASSVLTLVSELAWEPPPQAATSSARAASRHSREGRRTRVTRRRA